MYSLNCSALDAVYLDVQNTAIQTVRRTLLVLSALTIFVSLAFGQSSVPGWRQADRVAIITIEGAIDQTTARSVRRRITQAEQGGFDAMVFEINSPGGGVGAVLEITGAIKGSSIANTIAWVNTDAYSGGAIIALACSEIVSSSPGSMGDAFPVVQTINQEQQRSGLRGLTPDERTKILPVLLADVTDSARRHGYDEYLVQAIVIDGIELWLVENTQSGARWAINANEFRSLFGEDPPRGKPMLAQVTGGRPTAPAPDENEGSDGSERAPADSAADPNAEPSKEFQPASDALRDVAEEFASPERIGELAFDLPTNRPDFSAADADEYRLVAYINDGSAPIVMREDQLELLGFSSGIINTDEELRAFLGADTMIRQGESWSEKLVRFLNSTAVRGFLIVVFLVALFVEMLAPGIGLGGGIAVTALALLLAPPMLIGMAGWWELIAIGVGIICLMLEAFVLPGFGLFGIVGLVGLFGGLLGTFIPSGGSFAAPSTQQDLLTGATTMLLALVTTCIVCWLIVKNMTSIPILDRLVLSGSTGVAADPSGDSVLSAINPDIDAPVRIGDTGTTTTPLRPSGQADIDGEILSVYAAIGYIEAGTPVRVTGVSALRIEVSPIEHASEENA
jgi:membrane-bound serine protease (ClpP class)